MAALTLPRLHWGPTDSPHRALIVHGLGSSAQTCWRIGEALADAGWSATAVDLRGHGQAPRATSYRIADFADDLSHTLPTGEGSWDVVIGHSIGAASAIVAQDRRPDWASRLVLIDPAITVDPARRAAVLAGQLHAHDHLTEEEVSAENPHWHPMDIELRVWSNRQASRFALERAVADNDDWDVEREALSLQIPTLVIGGDPAVDSMFTGEQATRVVAKNSLIHHVVISGAGHSVHRDRPEHTLQALREFVEST